MNYELIFYHSGRTAEIEKIIADELSSISLSSRRCSAATEPKELAENLKSALSKNEIIFIVGGLDGGLHSTDTVLSEILSFDKSKTKTEKIEIGKTFAEVMTCKNQTIAMIPDDTDFISKIIGGKLKKILMEKYSLKEIKSDKPPIENISHELEQQLASRSRVRIPQSRSTAEKRNDKKMRSMKAAVIILGTLGIIQLGIAAYLLLTNYLI